MLRFSTALADADSRRAKAAATIAVVLKSILKWVIVFKWEELNESDGYVPI